MEEELVKILINKNLNITCAESCTGGMVAASIINVANASKVINESYVTYSNEAKERILGVNSDLILKYGVVSEEVAKDMAKGAAGVAKTNCAISTSGIAGPTGETKDKPIGMVCFGAFYHGHVITDTKYFGNLGRNVVRKKATEYAILLMIKLLESEDEEND